ncbi:hypothetical protein KO465_04820 [Candidatus Micrarchaeota archaeon]|nr:hypothetical protein [Candidatus Micrarchaeota archaeon]
MIRSDGPLDAKIMLVGEAPDSEASRYGKPFCGREGKTLDDILSQAGIARYQCYIGYVARSQPPADKMSLYFEDKKCNVPTARLRKWVEELRQEIILHKPNIVIAFGMYALWALTGLKSLQNYRGYVLSSTLVPDVKVLATHSPRSINDDWKLYFPAVLDLRKAAVHSNFPDLRYMKQTLEPNVTAKQFIDYMEECIAHPEWEDISVDIETIQPGSHVEELGLSHDPSFGISLYFVKGRRPALPENDELKVWQTFARLMKQKKAIMQNAAFDIGVLWYNNHILVENLKADTLIQAHVCWPELPRDLGFLGSVCLNVPPWKHDSGASVYNSADAANTFGISRVLDGEIDRQNVRHTFDFEMGLIPIALMMQLKGIKIDEEKRNELYTYWKNRQLQMKSELDIIIGKEINFKSHKQMKQLLYFDLGLPIQYKRRKSVTEPRVITTDATALRTLERLVPDNPVFNLILEYKKATTLINNFLTMEASPEGTVHTSYNITGAASDDEEDTKKTKRSFGRWSSSKSIIRPYGSGNLQNIPNEARKMFKAPSGYKIIESDYSQAEAVVVAHLINDQRLIRMFEDSFGLPKAEKAKYDIHKLTYAQMVGIPMDQVTAEQRKIGKTIRHGTNYSAGPKVIMNRLGISMTQAKQYIQMYHRANPALGIWHTTIQQELRRTRTLTNLLGRKHKFLDRWGDDLFRSAYSFIPQSTVGDLLNVAMKKLYDTIPSLTFDIELLLQLHDAMYNLVKEEFVMDAVKVLRKCMLIPLRHNFNEFYIDVDFKVKDSWAEGEELDIDWRTVDV